MRLIVSSNVAFWDITSLVCPFLYPPGCGSPVLTFVLLEDGVEDISQ